MTLFPSLSALSFSHTFIIMTEVFPEHLLRARHCCWHQGHRGEGNRQNPLPSRSRHRSGSLVIIIVYPNGLYIFPSLVEFVWLLWITAIEWSLFMIFCPTSFLKGSGIPSSKGAYAEASLTVSRHLFSLEIGWLKGPDQSPHNQEVINRGKLDFSKFLCAQTRRCPCNVRVLIRA